MTTLLLILAAVFCIGLILFGCIYYVIYRDEGKDLVKVLEDEISKQQKEEES